MIQELRYQQGVTRGDESGRSGGLAYGLGAYGLWGFFPLFWKQLGHVPPLELLFHRVVWAFVFFMALGLLRGRLGEVRAALRNRKVLGTLAISAVLVAINWFLFVYAVATDRVLHVSLGYFINPLVSVMLGMFVLGERLRRLQWVAVGLAAAGVLQMAITAGHLPWISLLLAASFGTYGLLRKTVKVEGLPGTTVETLVLGVPFLGAIIWYEASGVGHFSSVDARTTALLLATGAVTATPLWWFANAARRMSLTAIGFLQYLAPSMHFVLAVFLFDEPFENTQLITFACIWAGVALFVGDVVLARRRAI